ncbi:hypothetical protein DSO57_1000682 [Entomophthora muscae]|nr:hypothetical protein DSO57_1000682 [Entomophthora muscae]
MEALSQSFTCLFLMFDFLFFVADKGACDESFPLLTIQELSSATSAGDLMHIVAYLSDRILIVTNQMIPARGKGLAILRFFNELQRRCSTLNQAHLIGELKIMLTLAFPLNDRSGLNPRGDFDTSFQVVPDLSRGQNLPAEVQQEFLSFWKLQDYLANPLPLFEGSVFEEFKTNVNWCLKTFEVNIRDARSKVRAHRKYHEKRLPPSKEEFIPPLAAPRFLPDICLLPSQMCEPDFQKTILVQMLILFQYLQSITPETLAKLPAAVKPPADFMWKEAQLQWISERTEKIYWLLKEIPFGSDKFHRFIRGTLETEPIYASRKNVGAKLPSKADEIAEAERLEKNAQDSKAMLAKPPVPLEIMPTSKRLEFLMNLGEANKSFPTGVSLKRGRPSLDEFLSEKTKVVKGLEDRDDYRLGLSWKALRLAYKTQTRTILLSKSLDIMDVKAASDTLKLESAKVSPKPE